jgi:outer membrane protein assembly factor BamB
MTGDCAAGINIEDGSYLWKHTWPFETRILQPAFLNDGELLINSGQKRGVRRIKVKQDSDSWDTEEIWTSTRMRTEFNDFVTHKAHIYGFDGPNIVCIDTENGERKWKGNRYGGQLILLVDQDLLLILSEKGEIVLVKADPEEFKELSKMEAIIGKTWNHPVLVNDVLLVRNAKEMVAFRIS